MDYLLATPTIHAWFDPDAIVAGEESLLLACLIFTGIALVLYSAGGVIFSRRNFYL